MSAAAADGKQAAAAAAAGAAACAAKPDQRISTLIAAKEKAGETYYSFEYFPPKLDEGKHALYERLESMSHLSPSFIDITWRLRSKALSIEVSSTAQMLVGVETQMHLCCAGLTNAELCDILAVVRKAGIRNILALRGDPLDGQSEFKAVAGGCRHSTDLVTLIRAQPYGQELSVGVAGYPEGLGECPYAEELQHLKLKVDAGADYIISQLFWDVPKFLRWIADCRAAGIKVPILAGLLPIQSYASFRAMSKLNPQVSVPAAITQAVEAIKGDDKAIREYGVRLAVRMCRELMAGGVHGFHFYTLNLEAATARILDELGLLPAARPKPALPYKSDVKNGTRPGEEIRPIFWANRPKSYIMRTANWDEYPNARWGDSRSAAFGSLDDHHLFFLHAPKPAERARLWGAAPTTAADVGAVFAAYLRGTIERLPWCDRKVEPETALILQPLVTLNDAGFWTINSQPAANAVPSEDKALGWGPKGGVVYQKAYIEFFCSPHNLELLLARIAKYPSLSYHAECAATGQAQAKAEAAAAADVKQPNAPAAGAAAAGGVADDPAVAPRQNVRSVNAVTWGVFPNEEVVQPTVVDPLSFRVWKAEAFGLWLSQWASIYPAESASRALIEQIHSTYWLVNIVDNDFIRGGQALWQLFGELVPALKPNATAAGAAPATGASVAVGAAVAGAAAAATAGTKPSPK